MIIFQPDREYLKRFIAKYTRKMEGSVLDVGGGTRRYAHLFKHCKEYRVLDLNAEVAPDIVASAEKIPLLDASVDGILCSQVLGDIPNVTTAIGEMTRILKPGGHILLTESLFNEQHDEPYDFWRFTAFAWQLLLHDNFVIEVLEPRGGFYSSRAQNQIRYRIEKHRLYQRPIVGRLAHLWATCIGKYAIWHDTWDDSAANQKFPIGFCVFARKK